MSSRPVETMVTVRVRPGARRTKVAGRFGDLVKIAVAAPPVDGAANDELVRFVAAELGVRRRDVRVVIGARARTKRLAIAGAAADDVDRLFPSSGGQRRESDEFGQRPV